MRLARRWLVLALALVWAPMAVHCQVEAIAGVELFRCAAAESEPAPPDSHCDHSICCEWEFAQYQPRQSELLVALPFLPSAPMPLADAGLPREELRASVPLAPPPELAAGWQFAVRAAHPVRAPSFVS